MVQVGETCAGKVTGLTRFGAFIELETGESGLVHISEIAHTYVENVEDVLQKGQEVKVVVTQITPEGKYNFSIKKATPKPENLRPHRRVERTSPPKEKGLPTGEWEGRLELGEEASFEDKITKFLKESNEKNNSIRARDNKRAGIRKPKR